MLHKLNTYDNGTEATKLLKLLSVEIDHQLRCNQHTSTLHFKEAMQSNAVSRLQRFMGKAKKNAVITGFIYANFNYYPLDLLFCSFIRNFPKN